MAKKDEEDDDFIDDKDDDESPDDKDEDDDGKPSKEEETVEVVIDEDDDKDERVTVKKNKEYSEESLEEKRARRRDEKKRKKHQDYLNRQRLRKTESENADLKKRLEALEQLAPKFQQRVDAQEEMQLDTAISSQANLYRAASEQLEKAITEGNGAAAKQAQQVMLDANTKYSKLIELKQKYKENSVPEKETAKEAPKQEIGEAHRMYARRWASKNTWFDPNGDDEESETAKIIDKQLIKDGYNPNDKDFWLEFEERIKEELPHLAEEKPVRRASSPRPKQTNGSIGADSHSSGTKTLKIPASVMKMAQDAGYLDDPKMKKIFINNWKAQQSAKAN